MGFEGMVREGKFWLLGIAVLSKYGVGGLGRRRLQVACTRGVARCRRGEDLALSGGCSALGGFFEGEYYSEAVSHIFGHRRAL